MSEPIRKTGQKAPIGARYIVEWQTDAYVTCKNQFKVAGEPELRVRPGRKPRPPQTKGAQQVIRGDVVCTTTIKVDGKDSEFPKDMPDPAADERMIAGKFVHAYKCKFTATVVGKYEFLTVVEGTVNKLQVRQEYVTEVEVTPAEPLTKKRKDLIDTCELWVPTSIKGTKKRPTNDKDLMERTGWGEDRPAPAWSIPAPPRKNTDTSAITYEKIPVPAGAVFVQKEGVVTADGQGNASAAKSSFNKNILPGRIAQWDALVAADKAANKDQLKEMVGVAKPAAIPVVTSCIDIANELVKIWGGAFPVNLHAMGTDPKHPKPDYYRVAKTVLKDDPEALPKPGDIIFLGKPGQPGFFQHVCILISRASHLWVTADGGGGALPEQTASMADKPVEMSAGPVKVPMILSVTDGQKKEVHGWIDLDAAPHPGYNSSGNKI